MEGDGGMDGDEESWAGRPARRARSRPRRGPTPAGGAPPGQRERFGVRDEGKGPEVDEGWGVGIVMVLIALAVILMALAGG